MYRHRFFSEGGGATGTTPFPGGLLSMNRPTPRQYFLVDTCVYTELAATPSVSALGTTTTDTTPPAITDVSLSIVGGSIVVSATITDGSALARVALLVNDSKDPGTARVFYLDVAGSIVSGSFLPDAADTVYHFWLRVWDTAGNRAEQYLGERAASSPITAFSGSVSTGGDLVFSLSV